MSRAVSGESAMHAWEPQNPNFEADVRRSFRQQQIMIRIGAVLSRVTPGDVQIEIPFDDALTQQHGYLHAGVVTAIADSACGYAALSLAPAGIEVLTVEYKVNFLAPARGQRFVARGRVIRPGHTISVCEADVTATTGDLESPVAAMLATIIRSRTRARSG